ncbi:unnamed protein product [Aspergillus oryzae]|nr:unnamed protein product [Aspergillus oryzae]
MTQIKETKNMVGLMTMQLSPRIHLTSVKTYYQVLRTPASQELDRILPSPGDQHTIQSKGKHRVAADSCWRPFP